MDMLSEVPVATSSLAPAGAVAAPRRPAAVGVPWVGTQAVNVTRYVAALRPFRRDEFAAAEATPTEGHIQAVNRLLATLRHELLRLSDQVGQAADQATATRTTKALQRLLRYKDRTERRVQAIEQVWDFYFELFGQRQSRVGTWLLACDRIALDCYQVSFTGVGVAKSIPAPPPFAYMRTGFSPATFRRHIPLQRLGRQLNPFPLVQLPYHRLVNPWTLGAILHEVSHNLQNDLGLNRAVPRAVALRLLQGGFGREIAATWVRWNREMFADVSAVLLGGPTSVASLMDVLARTPAATLAYPPRAVHPTPYLRPFIGLELLRRLGFPDEARRYRQLWTRMYPDPRAGTIPDTMLETFTEAHALVVDAVCFQPYPELGNKSLAQVLRFAPKEQQMIEEAAGRLATGTDPGVIPARFLIGAARVALDRRLAQPETIAANFYRDLARR